VETDRQSHHTGEREELPSWVWRLRRWAVGRSLWPVGRTGRLAVAGLRRSSHGPWGWLGTAGTRRLQPEGAELNRRRDRRTGGRTRSRERADAGRREFRWAARRRGREWRGLWCGHGRGCSAPSWAAGGLMWIFAMLG